MRTRLALAAAVMLGVLAAPSTSGATTYCVHGPAGCPADGTVMPTIQAALDDAYGVKGDDTVLIGPGDFTESAFQGLKDGGAVEIAGAGRGQTTLRYENGGVDLQNPASVLRDVTIRAPAFNPSLWIGLHGTGIVRRVDVVTGGGTGSVAVEPTGGPFTIEDSSIDAGGTPQAEAVTSGPAPDLVTVRNTVIRGGGDARMLELAGDLTVERSRLLDGAPAIITCGAKTAVRDSLIVSSGLGGAAIETHTASCGSPAPAPALEVRNATVMGGDGGGIFWEAGTAGGSAIVADSIIRSAVQPLFLKSLTVPATLTVDHSDFDPAAVGVFGVPGSAIDQGAGDRFEAAPGFVDAAAGDYRLRATSPLVDAGGGVIAPAALDLAGLPRLIGGAPDIGAYEYQRRAPSVSAQWLITPLGFFPGTAVQLTATATDPDPDETPTLTWAFDDGGTASGASVTHAFATAGDHTATVTATDPADLTATATVSIPVQAPLVAQQQTPPPPATKPAVTLPSALTARRGVIIVGVRCRAAAGRVCAGTVTLSVPAGKGRYRTVARGRYSLLSGVTGAVTLKLSRSALAAVRHAGRRALRLRATLTGRTTTTHTVRVTLRR